MAGSGGGTVDAEKFLDIAEKFLSERDLIGSKTYATRAKECDPRLDRSERILAVVDTLLAGISRINEQYDWYAVLQLARGTRDPKLISAHYDRLAFLLTPVTNSLPFADLAFRLVSQAHSILSDSAKKSIYDHGSNFFSDSFQPSLSNQYSRQPQPQPLIQPLLQQQPLLQVHSHPQSPQQQAWLKSQQPEQSHPSPQQFQQTQQPYPHPHTHQHHYPHSQPQQQPPSQPHQQQQAQSQTPSQLHTLPLHSQHPQPPPQAHSHPSQSPQLYPHSEAQLQLPQPHPHPPPPQSQRPQQQPQPQQQQTPQSQLPQGQLRQPPPPQPQSHPNTNQPSQLPTQPPSKPQPHQRQAHHSPPQTTPPPLQPPHQPHTNQPQSPQLQRPQPHATHPPPQPPPQSTPQPHQQPHSQPQHQPQPQPQSEPQSQLKTKTKTKTKAKVKSKLNPKPQPQPLSQRYPGTESQPQAQPHPGAQAQTQARPQTQSLAQVETETPPHSWPQPEVQTQPTQPQQSQWHSETPMGRSSPNASNTFKKPTNEVNSSSADQSDIPAFWTACPYCLNLYEYPLIYQDCCLLCQNCGRAFHGVVLPPPPGIGTEKEMHFCCWGYIPLGFSEGTEKTNPSKKTPGVYIDEDDDDILDSSIPSDDSDEDWEKGNDINERSYYYAKKNGRRGRGRERRRGRGRGRGRGIGRVHSVVSQVSKISETQSGVEDMNVVKAESGMKVIRSTGLKREATRGVKDLGKLDLNVEFSNEVEESSVAMDDENEGMEGTGFFEGLDEFLSNLPLLKVAE